MRTLAGPADAGSPNARGLDDRSRPRGVRARAARERGRRLRRHPARPDGRSAVHRRDDASCSPRSPARRRVMMLGGGKKRYGESATDKLASADERQAGAVSPRRQHRHFGAGARRARRAVRRPDSTSSDYSRWALYNMWRSIDATAAGLPARGVRRRARVAPDDEVTVTAVTHGTASRRRCATTPPGYRYNPEHRWHYFRDMTRRRGPGLQGARHRPDAAPACAAHRVHGSDLPAGHADARQRRDARARALRLTQRKDSAWRPSDRRSRRRARRTRSPTSRIPIPTHFVDNLAAVVDAMNDEAQLTPGASRRFAGMLTVALRNRMEVDRYVADAPRHRRVDHSSPRSSSPGSPGRARRTSSTCSTRTRDLRMLRTWEGDRPCRRLRSTPSRARAGRGEHRAGAPGAGGDRRADRRDAPHRRRRSPGVPGDPRPDLRQPRPALDDVGARVPRLPAHDRRPARRVRAPRRGAAGCCSGVRRAAVDAEVAVPPARAGRDRRACTPTPSSW